MPTPPPAPPDCPAMSWACTYWAWNAAPEVGLTVLMLAMLLAITSIQVRNVLSPVPEVVMAEKIDTGSAPQHGVDEGELRRHRAAEQLVLQRGLGVGEGLGVQVDVVAVDADRIRGGRHGDVCLGRVTGRHRAPQVVLEGHLTGTEIGSLKVGDVIGAHPL